MKIVLIESWSTLRIAKCPVSCGKKEVLPVKKWSFYSCESTEEKAGLVEGPERAPGPKVNGFIDLSTATCGWCL